MARISTKDWANLPIEKWNTTTVHAYLIDMNRDKFGVEYLPFGKGTVQQRWSAEKGQIKTALTKYGAEVIKTFIDECLRTTTYNERFPVMNFGFIYSYRRDVLTRVEADLKRKEQRKQHRKVSEETVADVTDDWF